jgi:hypothetical protein
VNFSMGVLREKHGGYMREHMTEQLR